MPVPDLTVPSGRYTGFTALAGSKAFVLPAPEGTNSCPDGDLYELGLRGTA